ncbi:MAG: serine hydrolase domain-containing protein [Chitinophagaceae bacterium]
MKQRFLCFLLFTFLLNIVNAQLDDSLVKKVDAIFAEYDNSSSPGCALAILKDGKIIYKKGYGMSSLEYHIAISPASIFHVASLSKQFTAAALIELSLEGKLSLNDDIRKYIPAVPDFGHVITFNHLLHHTSGLRDQWELQGLAGWRDDDLITERDIMEMLARQKALNFLPGDEYSYCNTGYTLIAVAIKKITGVSLRAYADSVFFNPLGMTSTHFHSDHAEITPNRTSAYRKDDKGIWKISIPVFDTYGATSLFTTVEDLAKWDENFYTKKIGGNNFVTAMQLTGFLNDNTPMTYAAGLDIQTYNGYKTVAHGGADAGYRSYFLRFPDQHFSVILLANLANIKTRLLSNKVADIFLKNTSTKDPLATIKIDTNIVKAWAGDYLDRNSNLTVTLIYRNEKLLAGNTTLKPSSNVSFTDPDGISAYSFRGNSSNAKFVLSAKGLKNSTFEKVKKITLTAAQLQEYRGEYFSAELDTKYKITVPDTVLLLKIPRNGEIECTPFIRDMFSDDFTILFSRNKTNKIIGFFLSTERVRNVFFERQYTTK